MADPIARDTLNTVMKQDEAKGAAVHTFNPNSSPEEKATKAGQGREELDSVSNGALGAQAHGMSFNWCDFICFVVS